MRHCADLVTSTERQEPIQKCFRSLEFIFKFIIQSRQLFARATQGNNFTLIDILDLFLELLKTTYLIHFYVKQSVPM